jgi:peptidoglycan hydrolase-like protein with peptidoglycan-binding domain
VQQRLIELGYLIGAADGKWGPRSKAALIEFKSRENLPKTDVWDDITQRALFKNNTNPHSNSQNLAGRSFVGGWTNVSGQCGDPGEPLRSE